MKKPNLRIGFNDLIITHEEDEKFSKYVTVYDSEGNAVGEIVGYLVGYEDEDGNETDEDGNEL
jgi:hypothetical protein